MSLEIEDMFKKMFFEIILKSVPQKKILHHACIIFDTEIANLSPKNIT